MKKDYEEYQGGDFCFNKKFTFDKYFSLYKNVL